MLEAILAVEVEHADDLSDLLDDSPSKSVKRRTPLRRADHP